LTSNKSKTLLDLLELLDILQPFVFDVKPSGIRPVQDQNLVQFIKIVQVFQVRVFLPFVEFLEIVIKT